MMRLIAWGSPVLFGDASVVVPEANPVRSQPGILPASSTVFMNRASALTPVSRETQLIPNRVGVRSAY